MRFFWPNKPVQIYDPEKLLPVLGDLSRWRIQSKWNGFRTEIACSDTEALLQSREGRQWPEKSHQWAWLRDLPLPRPWYLDGEWLRDGRIYVWDYAVLGGQEKWRAPYFERLERLQDVLPGVYAQGGLTLACSESRPVTDYKALLKQSSDPFVEGIVWKNLDGTNFWGPNKTGKVSSQFKYRF